MFMKAQRVLLGFLIFAIIDLIFMHTLEKEMKESSITFIQPRILRGAIQKAVNLDLVLNFGTWHTFLEQRAESLL